MQFRFRVHVILLHTCNNRKSAVSIFEISVVIVEADLILYVTYVKIPYSIPIAF